MTANHTAARGVFRRGNLPWLAAYLALVAGVVLVMLQVRQLTLSAMATPAAQAEWNDWREAPPNVRTDLPVKRHPPSSDEPPSLVLMRDHFPVMMGAAVVFSSLLFAAIVLAARGALARDHRPFAPDKADP